MKLLQVTKVKNKKDIIHILGKRVFQNSENMFLIDARFANLVKTSFDTQKSISKELSIEIYKLILRENENFTYELILLDAATDVEVWRSVVVKSN